MPNIEIHGLNEGEALNKAKAMRLIIQREAPELFDLMVITHCNDYCKGFNSNEPLAYLRICSANPAYIEKLKTILTSLKMDIEILELKEFIPVKK